MDLTTHVAPGGPPLPGSGSCSPSSPDARSGARSSPLATRALGAYGERLAVRYLLEQSVEILDRNWRCVRGELDIVAREGPALVVCEVKTRSGAGDELVRLRVMMPTDDEPELDAFLADWKPAASYDPRKGM